MLKAETGIPNLARYMNAESFRENQKGWVLATPHPFAEKGVTPVTMLIIRHLTRYITRYKPVTGALHFAPLPKLSDG